MTVGLLRGLLGDLPLETAEAAFGDPLSELLPEEWAAVRGAVFRRQREFRAGRHVARKALVRAGGSCRPICAGPDRAPVWPPGFLGSITHTGAGDRGWAGAVVGRIGVLRAVGIDAELDHPLEPELWPLVLRTEERAALANMPAGERAALAKLLFSAKESVYKCRYAVTREFLEFEDVALALDLPGRAFSARICKARGTDSVGAPQRISGRFLRTQGLWVTAAVLPAE